MTEKLFTPEEAAKLLILSNNSVRNYLKSGELRGYKIGQFWRIPESSINEFLEARQNRPPGKS